MCSSRPPRRPGVTVTLLLLLYLTAGDRELCLHTYVHTQGSQRDLPVSAAIPGPQRCTFKAGKIWAFTTVHLQTPPPQSMTNISLRESRSDFLSTKRNKLQSKSLCCTTCWAVLEALCLCRCRGTHLCATVQGVYSPC